jgi:hypothetical protein
MMFPVLLVFSACTLPFANASPVVHAVSPYPLGRIPALHNPTDRHGPSLHLRSKLRYDITPNHPGAFSPRELISPDGRIRRRDANLGLDPAVQVRLEGLYQSPVTIGEGVNAQTFSLDFETGSADLWVTSTLLNAESRSGHVLYNPVASNTSVPLNQTWAIKYSDGSSASGVAFTDTVSFGGIVLKNAAVEAAVEISSLYVNSSSDGLLGLAPMGNMISSFNVTTTLEALSALPLAVPVFTAALTRFSEPAGFYTFGSIDANLSQPGVQFTNVTTNDPHFFGFWLVNSSYAVVNFDTTKQVWVFPDATTEFPTVVLPVGDANITLSSPEDFGADTGDASGFITGSIQDRGNSTFDIFGDSWLNNVYAVFDLGLNGVGKLRVGVVQRPVGVI